MVWWTNTLAVAIFILLHTCSALSVSKNASATKGELLMSVDMEDFSYNNAAGVHRFRINGEPKSGTTWVEVIVQNILDVTCREGFSQTPCQVTELGRVLRRDTARSSTVFEPVISKHHVPMIGHGAGFDAGTPPQLSEDELLEKATLFVKQLPQDMHYFAVLRDPRSVTISTCYHKVFKCPDADRFTQEHIEVLSKWIDLRYRFWSAVKSLSPNSVKLLFYEDLKTTPLEHILQISDFLGTPTTRTQAEKVEHLTSLKEMRAMGNLGNDVPKGGAKTGKVREGSTCNYAAELSPEVAANVTGIMRAALSAELNDKWTC